MLCIYNWCRHTRNKGTCSSSSISEGLAQGSVTRFEVVTVNSVEAVMVAVVEQLVSVSIETDIV